MNKILYYMNFVAFPFLIAICFVQNVCKAMKRAISSTMWEVKDAYRSNKRHYNM